MRTASLPMYDLLEVRPALDAIWADLAMRLTRMGVRDVPATLMHGRPLSELWPDPHLLLSQCCGYDLVSAYAGKLRPIATPRYTAPGCRGSRYSSVVVVREGCPARGIAELRGKACAINGPESHSGMSALRALVAPFSRRGRFFSEIKISGTHGDSLAMISAGEADVAAIDCVTYSLLARHRPAALAGLRPLCRTALAPGIPFVTRADASEALVDRLRSAIVETFESGELAGARSELEIGGVELLAPSAYARIAEFQLIAVGHGYPRLQ